MRESLKVGEMGIISVGEMGLGEMGTPHFTYVLWFKPKMLK